MEILRSNLTEIICAVIVAIASYIGTKVKNIYEEKVNTETKRKVVETVVNAVEQLYRDLSGEEKLDRAKSSILEMLSEKNIKITELELDMLIESVVNGFNKGIKDKATQK